MTTNVEQIIQAIRVCLAAFQSLTGIDFAVPYISLIRFLTNPQSVIAA